MKTRIVTLLLAGLVILSAQNVLAQQSLYGLRLQDAFNRVLTIHGPLAGFEATYTLYMPPALPSSSSLLYATDGAGQLGWTTTGTNGQVLRLVGGVPSWSDAAAGTVTSIGMSVPSGLSVSPLTITTSGTFAITTSLSGVVHADGSGFSAGTVSLSSPTEVSSVLLPANGGTGLNTSATTAGSLLYTSGAGTWATRDPGTSGYVLTMSGGFPNWVDPGTLVSAGWQLTGNSIVGAYNGATGSFIGTTNTQPLVIATTNISTPQPIEFFTNNVEMMRLSAAGELGIGLSPLSGRLLHVGGNGGVPNVRFVSLSVPTTSPAPGGVIFADDNGDLNRLPAPTSNDYVLASSTTGVLSWKDVNSLLAGGTFWGVTGNTGTTAWNGTTGNFLGTIDAQDLVLGTGATAATREKLRIYSGSNNVLLSRPGAQLQFQGTGSGVTTFEAGAQGATTVSYVLPTAQATANKQALINDGAGNLSWGEPAAILTFAGSRDNFEDFVFDAYAGAGSNDNQFSFTQATANGGTSDVDGATGYTGGNDYFGVHILGTGTNATGRGYLGAFNNVNRVKAGGKELIFETRVQVDNLSDATNHFDFYTGFMDGAATFIGDPANGIYFQYSDNVSSGQWTGVTRNASTSTIVGSGVTVVAGRWYVLRCVISADASNVDFYVDDVLVGSSTTNITTNAFRYELKIEKAAGNQDRHVNTDWVTMRMVR